MVTGRAFHNFGATDEKLRSPNLIVLLLGTTRGISKEIEVVV
jgi:hypothetical protein